MPPHFYVAIKIKMATNWKMVNSKYLGAVWTLLCCIMVFALVKSTAGSEQEASSDGRPDTWGQKILEWWLDNRKPLMTLFLGGMGLAWIITLFTRRDDWAEEGKARRQKAQNKNKVAKAD